MEVLKKKCQYCGKEITSLYEKQLNYNVKAHEIACKKNPDNKSDKGGKNGKYTRNC